MMPILDEINARIAEIMVAAGVGGAVAWKRWLSVRADIRRDNAGTTEQDVYKNIIEEQGRHIARLGKRLDEAEERTAELDDQIKTMATRINEEINRRYVAEAAARRLETEAGGMRAAIADLTDRLAVMGRELTRLHAPERAR
mgnify:FL=1